MIQKPESWNHSEAITKAQLAQMRDEFWDTASQYGGSRGIPSGAFRSCWPRCSFAYCAREILKQTYAFCLKQHENLLS